MIESLNRAALIRMTLSVVILVGCTTLKEPERPTPSAQQSKLLRRLELSANGVTTKVNEFASPDPRFRCFNASYEYGLVKIDDELNYPLTCFPRGDRQFHRFSLLISDASFPSYVLMFVSQKLSVGIRGVASNGSVSVDREGELVLMVSDGGEISSFTTETDICEVHKRILRGCRNR